MHTHFCRDCSKCCERGMTKTIKKWANLTLIICTLGLSIPVSAMLHSGRKLCPICKHPITRHAVEHGLYPGHATYPN
jgi:hypothetical protein